MMTPDTRGDRCGDRGGVGACTMCGIDTRPLAGGAKMYSDGRGDPAGTMVPDTGRMMIDER
jgi:hypothetical protein